MNKPFFEPEQIYSRRQIYNALGGDLSSNLPIYQGRVVYCCVIKISHPDAPEVILIARTGQMLESAKRLAHQREAISVFVKPRQPGDEWVYQGEFVTERYSDNPVEIAPYVRKAGRTHIAGVLFLKRISP